MEQRNISIRKDRQYTEQMAVDKHSTVAGGRGGGGVHHGQLLWVDIFVFLIGSEQPTAEAPENLCYKKNCQLLPVKTGHTIFFLSLSNLTCVFSH